MKGKSMGEWGQMDKPLRDLIEIIRFTEDVSAKIPGLLDEAEIYRTVMEEFAQSKRYTASILLLTEDASSLRIVETSLPPGQLQEGEKAAGVRLKGYKIDLDKSSIYRQVVREGKTLQVKVSDVIGELFPRPLAYLISKTLGYEKEPSILTPLKQHGKIIGALAISSTDLAEHLIPAVRNLAQHISSALELASEHTEHKRVEEELQESEERLSKFMDSATDQFALFDSELNFVEANEAALKMWGLSKEDAIGKNILEIAPNLKETGRYDRYLEVLKTGKPLFIDELVPHPKFGDVYLALRAFKVGEGLGFTISDITERKRAEERIGHLNLVLRAIRRVNQLITREKDRDRLLQGACDRLIETRGYYNAWIALLDEARGSVLSEVEGLVTTAEAGLGEEFTPLVERLKRGELTTCGRSALSQPGVVVTEDPPSTCANCPLAAHYGGRGALTVRLEHGGKVYGLLSTSIPAHLTADREEQVLFEEVAGDIAFALHGIELEDERVRAEEALRERVKELTCLYAVSRNMQEDLSVDELCQRAVEHLVPAMRFPEITVPVIELDGKRFTSEKYTEGLSHSLHAEIRVGSEARGQVWVYYAEERPFLIPEEQDLVNAIAEALGLWLQHKWADEALRESEERYRSLFEGTEDHIFVLDQDFRYVMVNPSALKASGFTLEDVVGKGVREVFPEDAEFYLSQYRQALETGKPIWFERELRLPDGVHWFSVTLSPIKDARGHVVALTGISRDITERKRIEEEIKQHNRELATLNAITTTMMQSALDLDAVLQRIADGVLEGLGCNTALILLLDEKEGVFKGSAVATRGKTIEKINATIGFPLVQIEVPARSDFNEAVRNAFDGRMTIKKDLYELAAPLLSKPVCSALQRLLGSQTFLSVPLLARGKVVGGIFASTTKEEIGEGDKETIMTFANQAAVAVENARLFGDAERLKAFNESIVQGVAEAILIEDAQGILTFANPAAGELLGYTCEALIGQHWTAIVPEHEREKVCQETAKRPQGIASHYETVLLSKEGQVIPVLVSAQPLFEGGKFVGILSAFTDITKRVRAEEEAWQRAAQAALAYEVGRRVSSKLELDELLAEIVTAVRDAFDYYGVMILLVDEETQYLTMQSIAGAYADIFPRDLCHAMGEGITGYAAATGQSQVSGDVSRDPHYTREADEKTRSELAVPIKSGEKVIGVIDIQCDQLDAFDEIDVMAMETLADQVAVAIENARLYQVEKERRRIAEALRQASTVLSSTLELDEVLELILQQLQQVIPYDSASVQRLQGECLEIIACQGFEDPDKVIGLVFPLDPKFPNHRVVTAEAPLSIEDVVQEYPHFRDEADTYASNHIRSWLGVPLLVKDEVIGMITLDRAEACPFTAEEAQLAMAFANQAAIAIENARLFDDLQTSLGELKLTQAQLLQAQKLESIGRLAGGVAHDFNNLLTTIRGFASLTLMDTPKDDHRRHDLQHIVAAADRAAALTRQLTLFSRREPPQRQPLRLNRIVQETYELLKETFPRTIEVELALEPRVWTVEADPSQISQVLMNLCLNARDAMPQGGTLTLETRNVALDEGYARTHIEARPGPYVLLAISDTGVGMSQEVQAHIFEPFFTTKGVGEGVGLGLATVHGIVKAHHGFITVYSEVGEGSTFHIYLPATEREVEAVEERGVELARGEETVLLVDDEEALLDLGRSILEKCGYTVLEARDGAEALEVYGEHREEIALVVLDLVMPEMDGRGCLHRLLEMDPGVRVLIATGYTANGSARALLKEGAMALVEKPYLLQGLSHAVREALDAAQGGKR